MSAADPIKEFQGENRFLSNFWPVDVVLDGIEFPSVEHGYQAAKTLIIDERKWFLLGDARRAKKYGRKITLRFDWESVKLKVMADLLRQKFSHDGLAKQLLATGDRELIEGNTWGDTFWGVCRGAGSNHLGKLLMEVRAELRRQDCQHGGDNCVAGRLDGVVCPDDGCDIDDGVRRG